MFTRCKKLSSVINSIYSRQKLFSYKCLISSVIYLLKRHLQAAILIEKMAVDQMLFGMKVGAPFFILQVFLRFCCNLSFSLNSKCALEGSLL